MELNGIKALYEMQEAGYHKDYHYLRCLFGLTCGRILKELPDGYRYRYGGIDCLFLFLFELWANTLRWVLL
jgi:hypothetical protein